jgi:GTPase-associated protein 1, N-terminal domain type 2
LIEQAIFTSARSAHGEGYHLAAASAGVCDAVRRELSVWGPSHDSLLDPGPDASSVNFHRLTCGGYCVAKTVAAGAEFSGRGGAQVYTQFLIVPAEVLSRFSNNPFALLAAAFAQGSIEVLDRIPDVLPSFRLMGKAVAVDPTAVTQAAIDPGADVLAAAVETLLAGGSLLLVGGNPARFMQGLFNCLPVAVRSTVSFSTGLKSSARRPYQIGSITRELSLERRGAVRPEASLTIELDTRTVGETALGAWAQCVHHTLSGGRTSQLVMLVEELRGMSERSEIERAAGARLPDLRRASTRLPQGAVAHAAHPESALLRPQDVARPKLGRADVEGDDLDRRRADLPHDQPQRASGLVGDASALGVDASLGEDPSQVLGVRRPEAFERLELLDDLVFEAIAGKPGALDTVRRLWPEIKREVGEGLVEESREQYVRHALKVWRECVEGDQLNNPALAITALEVVCVLFDR